MRGQGGHAFCFEVPASRKARAEQPTFEKIDEQTALEQIERSTVMASVASTAATLAFVVVLGAGTASAQSEHDQHHPQQAPATQGMPMQPGMMGQGMGPGMMGPGMMGPGMMGQMGPGMMGQMPGARGPGGMWHTGPHMMSPAEMQQMMAHMGGMMGQGGPGMGPDMMGPGMMDHGMQGFRVVPMMHLSTDDVRVFLQRHISAHSLTRLQVGEVTQTDDDTITADIVTREGSLALRLEIDAYTGFVESVS
jgi:hypothetical protein